MRVQELFTKDYIAHLRRHPMPEILSDECAEALSGVLPQYGDTVTHGAGLEVRLGEEERYADFIMNIDSDAVPAFPNLWYEIDYAEFRKAHRTGNRISPCLFANTDAFSSREAAYWDAVLQPFLGRERAERLRPALNRVLARMPERARIKQIGTMTGRGELAVMRLVILFYEFEDIFTGLESFGWPGDVRQLREAILPWKERQNIAVNFDLGAGGVLPKIGFELFSGWRHPVLVDRFISRLEEAGLCLPSKGAALRRWIRIRPDGDPFIQTLISYFKLNYADGRITEAKAYLEQSPYLHHHYFDAYDRPLYVELRVKEGKEELPVETAETLIRQCRENRVREVRFSGDPAGYPGLERLIGSCLETASGGEAPVRPVIELKRAVPAERLAAMVRAGGEDFILRLNDGAEEHAMIRTAEAFRPFPGVRAQAVWILRPGEADRLAGLLHEAENSGISAFEITGMTPGNPVPTEEDLLQTAAFLRSCEDGDGVKPTVSSCFSPLRALMGGEEPRENGNRGIGRGCTAGRDHFCILPSGSAVPCAEMSPEEAACGIADGLAEYWNNAPALQKLREAGEEPGPACGECVYRTRCLPCAVNMEQNCPIRKSL